MTTGTPAAFVVREKSPLRSSAVGMISAALRVCTSV
jgi:hypothetical protein